MNQKAVAKPSRGCVAADAEGRFKQAKVAEHNTSVLMLKCLSEQIMCVCFSRTGRKLCERFIGKCLKREEKQHFKHNYHQNKQV